MYKFVLSFALALCTVSSAMAACEVNFYLSGGECVRCPAGTLSDGITACTAPTCTFYPGLADIVEEEFTFGTGGANLVAPETPTTTIPAPETTTVSGPTTSNNESSKYATICAAVSDDSFDIGTYFGLNIVDLTTPIESMYGLTISAITTLLNAFCTDNYSSITWGMISGVSFDNDDVALMKNMIAASVTDADEGLVDNDAKPTEAHFEVIGLHGVKSVGIIDSYSCFNVDSIDMYITDPQYSSTLLLYSSENCLLGTELTTLDEVAIDPEVPFVLECSVAN